MKRAGMMWKIKKTNLLYPRSRIFMTKTRHSVQGIVPSRIQVYSWTLKDRACIKWQKFYQVLRAKLPQHSHFTIVSGQTLLAQKKSDHLGKPEIKLLVISLIYSRIFFFKLATFEPLNHCQPWDFRYSPFSFNPLARPAVSTSSKRDNQSMRLRCFRRSAHARALLVRAKVSTFVSYKCSRRFTRLGGWSFYTGQVFFI